MLDKDRDSLSAPAWALLFVLKPLVTNGHVDYLRGGLSSARHLPQANYFLVSGERELDQDRRATADDDDDDLGVPPTLTAPATPRKGGGLFQLRLDAHPTKQMPEIEQPTPEHSPSPEHSSSTPSPPPSARRVPAPFKKRVPPALNVGSRAIGFDRPIPQIEQPTPEHSPERSSPPPSPPLSARRAPPPFKKRVPPSLNVGSRPAELDLDLDTTPSPPPSAANFARAMKRPSAPNLRKLDTKSKEHLRLNLTNPPPKLTIRAPPTRAATLAVSTPSTSLSLNRPNSPSHLTLVHSTHSPTGSGFLGVNGGGSNDYLPPPTPSFAPSSPLTPRAFSPPRTARPDDTPSTEDAAAPFTISTILPGFLFLGPELTTPEHVAELQSHGVKRILNIAIECDDDQGLNLREVFEKYIRIPMRDTVEEENVPKCVRQVCDILGEYYWYSLPESALTNVFLVDDARLHSSPTYVHCKAGKSRSVTAVMAYLIHANHWTLSRAYSFVLERRKGISPNIGFVSELMTFEEQELGGKSHGVVSSSGGDADEESSNKNGSYIHAAGNRRAGHMRESLPPVLPHSHTDPSAHGGALSASGIGFGGGMGMNAGRAAAEGHEEMEIKDAQGRYRHARRAPVDEQTLQPSRRVSKAGLESSSYMALDVSDT